MKTLLLVSIIIGVGMIFTISGIFYYQDIYTQNCESEGGSMIGFLSCTKVWNDFATEPDMFLERYEDESVVKAFYAKYDDVTVSVKNDYVSYFAGNKTDFRARMNLYFDKNYDVANVNLYCFVGSGTQYAIPHEHVLYFLEHYTCLTYRSGDPLVNEN